MLTKTSNFFFYGAGYSRHLHSFPTRRSSDLGLPGPATTARLPDLSAARATAGPPVTQIDRKSTRLNSSHVKISYAVFCLKKKTHLQPGHPAPTGSDEAYPVRAKRSAEVRAGT